MRSAHGRPRSSLLCLAMSVAAMSWPGAGAWSWPSAGFDITRFLTAEAGFSVGDIQRLERGEVIVNGLPADEATVALATAALMAVPPEFFLDRFRQIEQFKKSAEVQQIGRVGVPPSAAAFAGLTLEESELKDARQCRVGDCAFKLDAAGIARLREAPDDAAAMAALRVHLAQYVTAYLQRGNAALMEYHDRSRPLAITSQLQRILGDAPYLRKEWPVLHTAIGAFPGVLPHGLEHFIYWSKEKVGLRPVVSLTHAIIGPPADGVATIATKQLYASHYTTGSLGLTILADREVNGNPRTLVVYVNRTRVDVFDGILGAVKRPIVRSRARAGAERMMAGLRARLEGEFGRGQGEMGNGKWEMGNGRWEMGDGRWESASEPTGR